MVRNDPSLSYTTQLPRVEACIGADADMRAGKGAKFRIWTNLWYKTMNIYLFGLQNAVIK